MSRAVKPGIEEYAREDRIINRILARPHEALTYEQVEELRAFVRAELRRPETASRAVPPELGPVEVEEIFDAIERFFGLAHVGTHLPTKLLRESIRARIDRYRRERAQQQSEPQVPEQSASGSLGEVGAVGSQPAAPAGLPHESRNACDAASDEAHPRVAGITDENRADECRACGHRRDEHCVALGEHVTGCGADCDCTTFVDACPACVRAAAARETWRQREPICPHHPASPRTGQAWAPGDFAVFQDFGKAPCVGRVMAVVTRLIVRRPDGTDGTFDPATLHRPMTDDPLDDAPRTHGGSNG